MIVEIRTYEIKPGLRDRFVDFLRCKSGPVQKAKGIQLLGPFIDLENQNIVICLRGFPSREERDRMRAAFYCGPEWKTQLKAEAMTLVERHEVVVAETREHLFTFD